MNQYIVEIKKTIIETPMLLYIHRVHSYKKGLDGVVVSLNIEKAFKYKNEKSAQRAAQFYNGVITII